MDSSGWAGDNEGVQARSGSGSIQQSHEVVEVEPAANVKRNLQS